MSNIPLSVRTANVKFDSNDDDHIRDVLSLTIKGYSFDKIILYNLGGAELSEAAKATINASLATRKGILEIVS